MKLRAFTLIELLVVIVILALSIGFVSSWTLVFLDRTSLQTSTENLVSALRKQQLSAVHSRENDSHGIQIEPNQYTHFTGSSLATAIAGSPFTEVIPNSILLSNELNGGGDEIVFEKGSGNTLEFGTITLTEENLSESFQITIHSNGLIDWQ